MKVGVVKETYPQERRVALIPAVAAPLAKAGLELTIEAGAGLAAGFPDAAYEDKGVRVVADRAEIISTSEILLQVRTLGANPEKGKADVAQMRSGQVVIGFSEPLTELDAMKTLADRGVTLLAMELIPRITRAQSMDALSSMASIAGYKAVLIAADALPKMFPMMMTAAGTITAAKVFIIGAGVAGLQAIATAKRLGAVVESYDLRPAVKEQVESLGAKFVELELELETGAAEGEGGYARAMDETFYRKQREMMTKVVADADVVITTAAVPGKKAPILVTREMVEGMRTGSVIVDLAAERGGNCELTKTNETVQVNGVSIIGTTNLPGTVPYHASQTYARNVSTLLQHLIKDGAIQLDTADEITAGVMVCRDGRVVHPQVCEAMGIELPRTQPAETTGDSEQGSQD